MDLAASSPSNWFKLLVFLHLVCVIGGFGYLAYNGVFLAVLRRRSAAASVGAVGANRDLSQLAELLIVAALVFGVAAVGQSKTIGFDQAWVSAALALWVLDLGILHGFIRRKQRRYAVVAAELAGTVIPPGASPPGAAELDRLERAMSGAWGVFNLVVVAAVYLMVFQPGS
ncbi:MAG TPA: hypothetical protein VG184_01560 [Acidimicrobiales bacterium]|jgi:uncharacterized membrane protein|nr:hypothetical protein [Acidimicrobiales bacterium]